MRSSTLLVLLPFPGAWFDLPGKAQPIRIKVLRTTKGEGSGVPGTVLDERLTVACGEGAVRLTRVQREGKAPQDAEDFLRGFPLPEGTMLG